MSQILTSKLATVRRKHATVATLTGLTAAVGAFVLILMAEMFLDWWLNLSMTVRAAFLAINIAAVVWILLYAVFGPILYGPDDDEIALLVEDAEPAFRTRLIASIQLSRPEAVAAGASKSLVRAMIDQAESLAGPMDFARVIKTDVLTRVVVITLSVLILGGGAFAWGGPTAQTLLKRAFLSSVPVPRDTRVVHVTENLRVARGDNVEILALADGVSPTGDRAKTVYIKTAESKRKQDFEMAPVTIDGVRMAQLKGVLDDAVARGLRAPADAKPVADMLAARGADAAVYGATIENVQESFEYTVRLNDGESARSATVTVLPRPVVTRIVLTKVYPAYTGKSPEPVQPGQLQILEGSKLKLQVTASKPLRVPAPGDNKANRVHLIGVDKSVPLAVDPANPTQLTGEVDIAAQTTGFSINLFDADQIESKDPAVYPVQVIPDKAPVVRIVAPNRKEILAVRTARLTVAYDATDDFGMSKANLKYRVDEDAKGEQTIPLDLSSLNDANRRVLKGAFAWKLQDIAFTPTAEKPTLEGRTVEYWIEVEDNNAVAKAPGKGVSEHNMIRVGSEEEVKRAIQQRLAELGTNLRNTAESQEDIATRTQTIIKDRLNPTPVPAPK
ncbi:MAG TPA: DUF4175 family protein [Tepidisphaeraceae bacterium]|nr:DUF4175 family protein [Tepidisphaeraceae bacterium]